MSRLLYLDSSSLLALVLQQGSHHQVSAAVAEWESGGGTAVSSRLLWLEVERVMVREELRGQHVRAALEAALQRIEQLPVNDAVWERAGAIRQHIKTLDAIHLATCELVGATLLTEGLDSTLRRVAAQRLIPVFALEG